MDLCNPSVIRRLMEEAGIHFRKEFGQNFLINRCVPEQIAEDCTDDPHSMILEVGPGVGCLTAELAERYDRVVAVEIDRGLIPLLGRTLADYDNVTVLNQDILKTDLRALTAQYAEGRPVAVCANLPYYITTPILMYLLESGIPFTSITVMVQNEVAARLTATPGSRDYGAITAILGYYGHARRLFRVPASSFLPTPKVDSAVVRLDLFRDKPIVPQDEDRFRRIIKAAFEMRRKTLLNALSAALPVTKETISAALTAMGLPTDIRGERLSTAEFAKLSDLLG